MSGSRDERLELFSLPSGGALAVRLGRASAALRSFLLPYPFSGCAAPAGYFRRSSKRVTHRRKRSEPEMWTGMFPAAAAVAGGEPGLATAFGVGAMNCRETSPTLVQPSSRASSSTPGSLLR